MSLRVVARSALAVIALLAGCASAPAEEGPHGPAGEVIGRIELASDLPPAARAQVADRLERIEKLIDATYPFLAKSGAGRPLKAVVLSDPNAFADQARSHGVDPRLDGFACGRGEVVLLHSPDRWEAARPGEWLQAPRGAFIAETLFHRRLELAYGSKLEATWLEEGCARRISELAAERDGERLEAARRARDDLLAAFLPLHLGAEPALERVMSERGPIEKPRTSSPWNGASARGLAYAAVRFLSENGGGARAGCIETGFCDAAAHQHGASSPGEKRVSPEDEPVFERWLRARVAHALLDGVAQEPVQAARWEASAALAFVTNIRIPGDLPDTDRAARAAAARAAVDADARPPRLLDELEPLLVRAARSGKSDVSWLLKDVKRTIDERARGYGHPAIEDGKVRLAQTLAERLRKLSRG
jgi:hypothetical protein